jgi:hypothetical protein
MTDTPFEAALRATLRATAPVEVPARLEGRARDIPAIAYPAQAWWSRFPPRAWGMIVAAAAGLILAIALFVPRIASGPGGPPNLPNGGGPVPDVECPVGVSIAQAFCYATEIPVPGAPTPFDVGVPTTVDGGPITYVSVSDNAPLSGVPADDILVALHKTRSQAVVEMGTWSHGSISALYVWSVPVSTVLAATVANWDAPAVTSQSTATIGGRSVAVLSRRDGVKDYILASGPVVYVIETAYEASASELIAAIPEY